MPLRFLFLQASAPSMPGAAAIQQFLPIILMVAIFYFLVFMPMRRQQKNTKEMIKTLQAGQTVITSGGLVGTIIAVNDDTLILRVKPDNLKLQVSRNSVTSVVASEDQVKK
jgi:preprotein translocase subunit YajC